MFFWLINTLVATTVTEKCIDGDKCAVPLSELGTVFSNVVQVALGLGGIVFFIMLISGGFKYITSGGDPKAVEEAKKTLTYAIGGMVLLALSFFLLRFIEVFTGAEVTKFKIFQ